MTGLVTRKLEAFASRAKIVHMDIDIDSAEINKILEEKSEMKILDFSSWRMELDEQNSTDSQQSLKEISAFHSFNKSDEFVDFNSDESTKSPGNDCKVSYSMKDNEK
ncbi:hypothetical protein L2E82_38048 [Cichorium intybus]|uniref:Uncharacterized protein n=1 Tax=Cichorium intybus TaxID=13427 RepID=A0ACB9AH47_CICIN|nr:hypothetical protein L2E82_38048 [Cichorium intybus]